MKASEIREMSHEEMERKLNDLKEEMFNLRFQHEIGQLENSNKLKNTKRDIARIKTVLADVTGSQSSTQ
jgi:large subunit ribosomal protein L29